MMPIRRGLHHVWQPLVFAIVYLTLSTCDREMPGRRTLFSSLDKDKTQIDFVNKVEGDDELNIFNYRNFYNGGGVALGDINNDGLSDVFLISNMGTNRLFLNKGNFVFEDITEKAGVGGTRAWSTGATFADVDGDGNLDLYVCNAGNRKQDDRANELFINNGNLTFTEQAASYGLDDKGYSTHAAFFDYDRDGDLDMYLLNNSFIPVGKLAYKNLRHQRDSLGGHKLFRNDKGRFSDVSEPAGIFGSLISFGLGISIGDFNSDNWPDIYISNDFYERDYLYLNNHDGTFREDIKKQMQHLSLSSMGADAADLDNDGNLDIFVTDMLPETDARMKLVSTFEGYDLYQLKNSRDYHHQITQNTLQRNNGDNTFSEIARLSGVYATDWSWGALLFDMDNDGHKDIFVANGIYKDVTDQDFVNFLVDENTLRDFAYGKKFDFAEFQKKIPSRPVPNYAFRNSGNLKFTNSAAEWGLDEPTFSNGAAYGDLDNDGDMDLIVNNVNQQAGVFRNTATDSSATHFLSIRLKGYAKNTFGIGATVKISYGGKKQILYEMPNRGFQSSVDHQLIFGLGASAITLDSLTVVWPDDRMQVLTNIKSDQHLLLDHRQATQTWKATPQSGSGYFRDITADAGLDFQHRENSFVDYYKNPLIKQMYSTLGPAMEVGDLNSDGLDDIIFGGAKGQAAGVWIQNSKGRFDDKTPLVMEADTLSEFVDALLFDVDKDNDLDLFLVTGGNEYSTGDAALYDKLYINDGRGNFTLSRSIANVSSSGSCVAVADIDGDGDLDVFVGARLNPDQFGYDPPSQLYVNEGGKLTDATSRLLPDHSPGMVTAATWQDLDGDSLPELIVAGDWMPIVVYKNDGGRKLSRLENNNLRYSSGWWNSMEARDLNGDGLVDFILGNLGENSRLKADSLHPVELYIKDFDNNGAVEQIITSYSGGDKSYPMVLKHDLEKQLPFIKKRFVKYADYAGKGMNEIFEPAELRDAVVKKVYRTNSCILINKGGFQFEFADLPVEAQYSPVMTSQTMDVNRDGQADIVIGGNFFDVLPEIGRYDASYGLLLLGKGNFTYTAVDSYKSGIRFTGQVRKLRVVRGPNGRQWLLVGRNNERAQLLETSSADHQ